MEGYVVAEQFLFEMPEKPASEESSESLGGVVRVRKANRGQVEYRACALDDLLPAEHEARMVWEYVTGLDLSELYSNILSVNRRAGRPAIDPKILMALWIYATLRGIGSARELESLCSTHVVYQWICGGVSVNHHSLSDFRVNHGETLDKLVTQSVATLMHEELVTLDRVAHDGMRVRASAGSSSFRRRKTLDACLAEAEEQLQGLRAELAADPNAGKRRQEAARQRAVRERKVRIEAALSQMPEMEAKKKKDEKDKARVSTTDPDARVMKMANGGFNPAYNVQLTADTKTQVISGVAVVNSGSDRGQMAPMVDQHEMRYGARPKEFLADGGFAKNDDIDDVSNKGTTVYAPVQEHKKSTRDPHTPRDTDSPAVAAWRQRMKTDEAKEIYKQRASTIECVNAIARNRGLQQFRVRSLEKIRTVILWHVIAHNLIRAAALRAGRQRGPD